MATTSFYPADPDDILSWTKNDKGCLQSQLFNKYGVLYEFETKTSRNDEPVTMLYKTVKPNKQDRVAKLEWAANGGLGRILMGKSSLPICDLTREESDGRRYFMGPDGQQYYWRPRPTLNGSIDYLLHDYRGNLIAFFLNIKTTHYQIGDVHGELHFLRTAGMGTVMHPPMQDMVTLTAMLCRFNAKKAQFEFEKSQVEKLQVEKLGMQLELARKHRERGQGAGMEPARV